MCWAVGFRLMLIPLDGPFMSVKSCTEQSRPPPLPAGLTKKKKTFFFFVHNQGTVLQLSGLLLLFLLETCLLIGIVRTIGSGYCLLVGIVGTIDLADRLLVGIVGTIDF